jgi:dual specificity MAP kinase phosphatase
VCIAYVMAHCDLSMIESFLLVRSRRMNVLTQPTLLFVWELRGFEAHLARLKTERGIAARRRREEASALSAAATQGDSVMQDPSADDGFSLAGLSISSSESVAAGAEGAHEQLSRLRVEIGAGAGSVYGFEVKDCQSRDFNSGSLTRLDYYSAKLTHGYFCKLLSELNARYMVT